MAGQAAYSIHIPTHDNQGNKLVDLPRIAHEYLHQKAGIPGSFVTGPHRGYWEQDEPETFHHLTTYADDTPETDSHLKYLANTIGDAANQWGIFLTKHGDGAPQSWVVNNSNYREGEPAPDWAIDHDDLEVPHTQVNQHALGSLREAVGARKEAIKAFNGGLVAPDLVVGPNISGPHRKGPIGPFPTSSGSPPRSSV